MGIFIFPKDSNFRRKPKSDVHYLYKVFRSNPFTLSHKGSHCNFHNVIVTVLFYYDIEDNAYYFNTTVDATEDFPRFDMSYIRPYCDFDISFALYDSFKWLHYCGIDCPELSDLILSINQKLPPVRDVNSRRAFRRVNDNITKRLIRKYTTFATQEDSTDILPF